MSAGYVVGDNRLLSAGGAQVLFDRRDVGYLKGKIGMSREVENLIVKAGIPKSTIAQIFLGEDYNLEVPMIEVGNMDNLAIVLGLPKRVQNGTAVVVPFGGSPSASQSYTFASRNGSSVQFIKLQGVNVSSITLKNAAENVTYVANIDYIVYSAAQGLLMALPGGAITSGQIVHAAFTHTPVAFDEVLLGKQVDLINHQVEFLHISPTGKWLLHYCFWKCQGDGSIDLSLDTEASDVMVALSKLKAYNDEANHPTSATQGPTGFIRRVPDDLVSAYLATIELAP